jgi:hypothetical protein
MFLSSKFSNFLDIADVIFDVEKQYLRAKTKNKIFLKGLKIM